jgi:acyl-CoA reductase-like NAD-dependent aldehyde dehydrogenase
MANYPDLKLYIAGEWRRRDGQHVITSAETPFGGVKDTGFGREGGAEGSPCYTVVKNVSHLTA